MKYELEPENRNCADDILLNDLSNVARRLGKDSITKDDYEEHGRFSPATIQNRFGSWNKALCKSGLAVRKRMSIPREELLCDLKRVAALLGSETVSTENYRQLGGFSTSTVVRTFNSWEEAMGAAGLAVSSLWHPKVSDEELLRNMAAVWEALGRQPKGDELRYPVSKYSGELYRRRFDSWRKALEAFIAFANDESSPPRDEPNTPNPNELPGSEIPIQIRRRTPRQPGWKLTFLVQRRDRFSCRACGRSPATEPGVVLHMDHIVPWSKGGETVMDNLQTLCAPCNGGKSDLSMEMDQPLNEPSTQNVERLT